jgi:CoA-transferase family III
VRGIRIWLDYPEVRRVQPAVIYVASQGYGRGGPLGEAPAFGPLASAFAGATWLWNHPDVSYPGGSSLNHPDHIASKLGVVAVLADRRTPLHRPRGARDAPCCRSETRVPLIAAVAEKVHSVPEVVRARDNVYPRGTRRTGGASRMASVPPHGPVRLRHVRGRGRPDVR